ncbi:shikimate dehydrogenase [Halobacterium salinarum]|uniref:Shikimate dehydrogenase (NADP(+)) n=7 Tax=Halobacterium salinarum TaxID=2242 RepID=AROE_HALSA|nr:shikimate dehydrogenase [Halobacterium salinarum]B0R386.1 RecName: Full=Shikimate dehydrogenase (NADP(+)); Short=SDH [Halobacterium salinarum R1]Q9HS68.1 RecName: Full=Shikimate dehydrogenase (NADP(+)); Short=SDH [Halobacterium salinarum NRC-1]AAG18940.1 shikimate 5-dehydrogenase [Halobacterium salinarum NRC-1]MBB6089773.1 shikimate dehydrogenase [Halobacterium salinarum]MDL0124076.1 shikimate dehydrogenase [Halobacterium salinarum]MDL0129341.1 shikimate dehydrogenase [Halobacterium salina
MDVYGLIGNPVGHSLSPPLHAAAYDECGLDARYVTFEPAPDDAAAAIRGAGALGVAGLNVTAPFKQSAASAVATDSMAARVGAVNTIDFSGAAPRGYNTDVAGVKRAFAHHDVSLSGAQAVVVGAGGAGRAAAFALADAGATVRIANRTRAAADELAADVGGTAVGLGDLPRSLADATVLVHATTVGMDDPDTSPVSADALHDDLAVLDAVYSPVETRLLRDAAAAGATTIDGAWMLLYQGAEAFERWTGLDAPVAAMRAALRARL